MEEIFKIESEDTGITRSLKREANIKLASLKDSPDYIYNKVRFVDAINIAKVIDEAGLQSDQDIDTVLGIINKIWNVGILSPLTLQDNEFEKYKDSKGYRANIRYLDIVKKDNIIENRNAFNILIRAKYNHVDNKQEEFISKIKYKNTRVYISKGGIITGEYFENCIIRQSNVDKQCFVIQSIINIPVCIIEDKNKYIYAVDHRDPKLKALRDFYEVPIKIDEEIVSRKYNIRKYVKLNK